MCKSKLKCRVGREEDREGDAGSVEWKWKEPMNRKEYYSVDENRPTR